MSKNAINAYDVDPYFAAAYDESETGTKDIELLLRLIGQRRPLRILEPFCGTGRILIPLATAGHEVVGVDQAATMLELARRKIAQLPPEVQRRITLIHADVTASAWPGDFDVVLLASNCFYELACPEEQEGVVASAAASLRPGGYVFTDSDHMEGELAQNWRRGSGPSTPRVYPNGVRVGGASELIWFDAPIGSCTPAVP